MRQTFDRGTWLEDESVAYPDGRQTRAGRAVYPDGKVRAIRAGIPDTYFSTPAHGRISGNYVAGSLTVTTEDGSSVDVGQPKWLEFTVYPVSDAMLRRAREIGREHGKAAASWVFDGNTEDETYRTVLQGLDDGDPEVYDSLPMADLSGQWADGYTVDALASDAGVVLPLDETYDPLGTFTDRLASAYEEAFSTAVTDTVERTAREHLAA